MLTPFQMRAQVEEILGFDLRLRMYETLDKVKLTDDEIVVTTTFYRVQELKRETRFTGCGTRAMQFKRVEHQLPSGIPIYTWHKANEFSFMDPEFVPSTLATLRRVETPSEWNDQRQWEADCYRPGSESFPMDNYDRTLIQPQSDNEKSHDNMVRHWQRLGKVSR